MKPPGILDTDAIEARLRAAAVRAQRLDTNPVRCVRCEDRGIVEVEHQGNTVAVPCPFGCEPA